MEEFNQSLWVAIVVRPDCGIQNREINPSPMLQPSCLSELSLCQWGDLIQQTKLRAERLGILIWVLSSMQSTNTECSIWGERIQPDFLIIDSISDDYTSWETSGCRVCVSGSWSNGWISCSWRRLLTLLSLSCRTCDQGKDLGWSAYVGAYGGYGALLLKGKVTIPFVSWGQSKPFWFH